MKRISARPIVKANKEHHSSHPQQTSPKPNKRKRNSQAESSIRKWCFFWWWCGDVAKKIVRDWQQALDWEERRARPCQNISRALETQSQCCASTVTPNLQQTINIISKRHHHHHHRRHPHHHPTAAAAFYFMTFPLCILLLSVLHGCFVSV